MAERKPWPEDEGDDLDQFDDDGFLEHDGEDEDDDDLDDDDLDDDDLDDDDLDDVFGEEEDVKSRYALNPSHARTRSARIGELIREGRPARQAEAIAYREYGEGPMRRNPRQYQSSKFNDTIEEETFKSNRECIGKWRRLEREYPI
jgi:hypothetical protein